MAPYLVTGGAGFIGSHLTEELIHRGHRVRVLDSLVTGKRHNLDHLHGVEFIEGDLADLSTCEQAVDGMRYVLHQAAIPSVPRSVQDPITSNRANIDGTLNLLVAARDAGIKRFVYAGSSSAYGDTPVLPKHEDMPTNPLSPYALQKLVAEQYCQMFTRLFGFETVTIRYFNVFGPRQDAKSPYSGVIALFIDAMAKGKTPTIFGDGLQARDFVYVANVVQALRLAAESKNAVGRVYNIGSGGSSTILDLVAHLNELLGKKIAPIHQPPRAGDVRLSQACIKRAIEELGYNPTVTFREGLAKTVAG